MEFSYFIARLCLLPLWRVGACHLLAAERMVACLAPWGRSLGWVAWDVLLGSRAAAVCRAARPARLARRCSRWSSCGRGPVV